MPPPPAIQALPPIQIQMPKRSGGWLGRIFISLIGIVLMVSIVMNAYLLAILSATMGGPMDTTVIAEGDATQTVAVYDVDGVISIKQARKFSEFVRTVCADSNVRAVVIRVNSPGGAVAPSDQMNAGVRKLKATGRKVVVSMGGVAASGGYYLSAPADHIVAEPTTITGSIGVISQMPIMVGTMERIGMRMEVIRSTRAARHKASLNPFEEPSDETLAEHRELLDQIQELFMAAVDDGRATLTTAEVDELADGRIWIGQEAMDKKLVDQIGYLQDAVDHAATLAGLTSPHVVRYERRSGFGELLFGVRSTGVQIDMDLLDEIQTPRVMMIWRP
jgi:protease-4